MARLVGFWGDRSQAAVGRAGPMRMETGLPQLSRLFPNSTAAQMLNGLAGFLSQDLPRRVQTRNVGGKEGRPGPHPDHGDR